MANGHRTAEDLELPVSLSRLRELLIAGGASQAWVFGSYARGEQRPDSDLDILVRMDAGREGWDFLELVVQLDEEIPVEVDAMTRIVTHFLPYIVNDFVRVL